MAFSVVYDEVHGCVMARVSGRMKPSVVRSMAGQVEELFRRHGCRHILNDLREAHLNGSDTELRAIASAVDAHLPRDSKRALVVTEKTARFDYLETACFNRGHLIRFFNDFESACAWLTG